MTTIHDPITLSPEAFEREVQRILEKCGADLDSFRTTHREKLCASDGVYQIDVTARFSALGAHFVVLVECKHQKNPVKREVVQVLRDKVQSLGANKGMLFSTATFQKGAVAYALKHGIALIRITHWHESFVTFSRTRRSIPIDQLDYAFWFTTLSEDGNNRSQMLSDKNLDIIRKFIDS